MQKFHFLWIIVICYFCACSTPPQVRIQQIDRELKRQMLQLKVFYKKENGWKDAAAIASSHAAEFYKMKILKKCIEDIEENFTRFITICCRRQPKKKSG